MKKYVSLIEQMRAINRLSDLLSDLKPVRHTIPRCHAIKEKNVVFIQLLIMHTGYEIV
jgi:hypothetical protein